MVKVFVNSFLHKFDGCTIYLFYISQCPKVRTKKNPNCSDLDKSILRLFLSQQEKILHILNKARKISLNKIKLPTSLGKLVKLKLGDTLRVVICHNQRHLVQAEKSLKLQLNYEHQFLFSNKGTKRNSPNSCRSNSLGPFLIKRVII